MVPLSYAVVFLSFSLIYIDLYYFSTHIWLFSIDFNIDHQTSIDDVTFIVQHLDRWFFWPYLYIGLIVTC